VIVEIAAIERFGDTVKLDGDTEILLIDPTGSELTGFALQLPGIILDAAPNSKSTIFLTVNKITSEYVLIYLDVSTKTIEKMLTI
jgi:hypothetical protein